MILTDLLGGMRPRLNGLADLILELNVELPSDLSHAGYSPITFPGFLLQELVSRHFFRHINYLSNPPVFGGAVQPEISDNLD